jgi:hypothetical protein
MKTIHVKISLTALSLAGLLALPLALPHVRTALAADHRDAPGIAEDPRADINDVYAFINPNNSNVVIAMTVNPFSFGGAPMLAFSPDVLYEFNIDNTGDVKEDLSIQATFTSAVPGPQMVNVLVPAVQKGHKDSKPGHKPDGGRKRDIALSGPANGTVIDGTNGIRVFAGPRDDPFFFDLIYVFRLLGIQPGGPLTNRAPGIDFFAGFNVSVLAVEVPSSYLVGRTGDILHIWGTTSRAKVTMRSGRINKEDKDAGQFTQIERMGLPVINTVLISSASKDAFNRGTPSQDREFFRHMAIEHLVAINGDTNYSATLADVLLPDVLTLDVTKTDGFLNGRRPQDDVIDAVLNAASKGAVTSDGVNNNDVPFLPDFPFFAPPHGANEAIPARN